MHHRLLATIEAGGFLAFFFGMLLFIVRAGDTADNSPTRPESLYGYPTADAIEKSGYVHSMPHGHAGPLWTIEYLTPNRLSSTHANRDSVAWLVDYDQPPECRWSIADYTGSGWDKGHRAPAEDMTWSKKAMRDSFVLTNTMPQAARLNEDRTKWAGLEAWIRGQVSIEHKEAWVLTGGAFVPDENGKVTIETLGPGGKIWVPTHCWKSVLLKGEDSSNVSREKITLRSWLIPNSNDAGPFDDYRISTDQLEAVLGLDLWPLMDAGLQKRLEATP